MNVYKTKLPRNLTALSLLLLALSFNCQANDVDRISKLEKEVQEIKLRLAVLESSSSITTAKPSQVTESSSVGWKSIPAWRQLKSGMSPNEVRSLLGEPERVSGGTATFWSYPNGGRVTFYDNRLERWTEPK